MAQLTLVWTEASTLDEALLQEMAAAGGVELLRVERKDMSAALLTTIAKGGVIYVATDARDASRALALGADEVVRVGHMSRASISRAIECAGVRAEARVARDTLGGGAPEGIGAVLSLVASVLGHEMNTPLAVALLNCDALNESIPAMLDDQERLIAWATLVAPQPELRSMMTRLAQQPSPSELRVILSDLRQALDRATKISRLLMHLSAEQRGVHKVSAASTIEDVHELLRSGLRTRAEIDIDVAGPCFVRVGQPTLVMFIAALLAHAIESVRSVARGGARIGLKASEQEDAILIEISHNGRRASADLRPSLLEPYFASNRVVGDLTVEGLQRRARLLGGELLVLSEAMMDVNYFCRLAPAILAGGRQVHGSCLV
jgi:signal transduction histidine kinase